MLRCLPVLGVLVHYMHDLYASLEPMSLLSALSQEPVNRNFFRYLQIG